MSDTEKMKKKLELMKVQTARFGYELKIQERLEDIERIKKEIDIQESREMELKEELGE